MCFINIKCCYIICNLQSILINEGQMILLSEFNSNNFRAPLNKILSMNIVVYPILV